MTSTYITSIAQHTVFPELGFTRSRALEPKNEFPKNRSLKCNRFSRPTGWRFSIRQSIPPESKASPFLQPPDDPCLLHFYFEFAAFNENNNDGRQTVTQNRSVPIHFSNLSHCPRKSIRFIFHSSNLSFSSTIFQISFDDISHEFVERIRDKKKKNLIDFNYKNHNFLQGTYKDFM